MKVETDGESVSVETDKRDVKLARAVSDGVSAFASLASTFKGKSTPNTSESDSIGECEQCGTEAPLRKLPGEEDGKPAKIPVCGECQETFTHNEVERAKAKAATESDPIEEVEAQVEEVEGGSA